MDHAEIGFQAIISLRRPVPEPVRAETAKAAFWAPIRLLLSSDQEERISDDTLQARVERELPQTLHHRLARHFLGIDEDRPYWIVPVARELNGVFFRARIVGYGSADLEVTIGGIKTLAALVNDHLDTFTMLMETFVPEAFAQALPSPLKAGEFTAQILPTAALRAAFVSAPPAAPEADTPLRDNKNLRALATTAVSLLTPVLLGLIVLWIAAQMVMNERAHLEVREKHLVDEELALRQADGSRLAALETQNLELARLLHAIPPPPAAAVSPPAHPTSH